MRQSTPSDRLTGWASIGGYIGRDARTAQRYERDRGLPVRRMPGDGRSTVFALRAELDGWMLQQADAPAHPEEEPPSSEPVVKPKPDAAPLGEAASPHLAEPKSEFHAAPPPSRDVVRFAALSAVGLISVLGCGVLFAFSLKSHAPTIAWSSSLYDQQGAAAWSERTPESLVSAIDDYTQAVVQNPEDAVAYVGLANSYNLAPELIGMAPAQAYPQAQAAAERALTLAPASADAHRALAFTLFWWGQHASQAQQEFREALALDPTSPLTHHWYANVLGARGDPHALGEIDRALSLAPSPAILIDKGWILCQLGRVREAQALLQEATRLRPGSVPAHIQLALVLRRSGDVAGELKELRTAAALQHDDEEMAVLTQAEQAYTVGGRTAMEQVLARRRAALLANERGSPFRAAVAASDVRRREDTLRFLALAKAAHDPAMMSLRANADFAWLRDDRAFQALAP